jgi:hypothetical protein
MLNMGRFQILSRFLHNILARQHMFHFGRVEAVMVCDQKTIDVSYLCRLFLYIILN